MYMTPKQLGFFPLINYMYIVDILEHYLVIYFGLQFI